MKYLIGEISKFWWIAAVVIASSCAPVTGHQLKGLADTSLEKGQITGAGTTGGNPDLTGLGVDSKDPNGVITELALCINPNSLSFLGGVDSNTSKRGSSLLPIAEAKVDLVSGRLVIIMQGISVPDQIFGVDFDLIAGCGGRQDLSVLGENSALVSNVHGTWETTKPIHVSIEQGQLSVVNKSALQLTVDATGLLRRLAGVDSEDALIRAFDPAN